jgi:hypothetical protein
VFRYGGADPEATLLQTLATLNRLLQPEMGDSAPLYVGQVPPPTPKLKCVILLSYSMW